MPAGAKARLGLYVGSHHQGWGSHHVVARQAGPCSISSPRERVRGRKKERGEKGWADIGDRGTAAVHLNGDTRARGKEGRGWGDQLGTELHGRKSEMF